MKWRRILASFLTGRAWHAIEAARELHTVCLHTDIAKLTARGLIFDRERVTVPGFNGARTAVTRYRLRPESYPQARALLGMAAPSDASQDEAARAYLLASRGTRG
jgi:hypothetical protein